MLYLTSLHSCFRTNRSVWKSREGHRGRGGSTCQVNSFRGLTSNLWETTALRLLSSNRWVCWQRLCGFVSVCVSPLSLCWHNVNSGGRKGAGVRMTELLSYQPDNLLPGHALLRKWWLWPELRWCDGSSKWENLLVAADYYFFVCKNLAGNIVFVSDGT